MLCSSICRKPDTVPAISERTLYYLTIAGIFAAVIVQTYIVFHMRLVPEVDLNHIYDYCVDMVETGKISFGESKYFAYNTNNIPLAIVIYYVFRMAAFTGMDYRIAGGLFNVLLILVMYVSAFLILKKSYYDSNNRGIYGITSYESFFLRIRVLLLY